MLECRLMKGCLPVLMLVAVTLSAQSASEVEITAEPHHHWAFENSYVRVFQVEAAAGGATLLHRHRHDYVYVTLGACEVSNEVAGKAPMTIKIRTGETRFTEGNFAHVVRDIGTTPFRNVTVEFLQDQRTRKTPPAPWKEERGMDVLEGGTQDILFVKDGVRVSEIDLQPGGMTPMQRNAPPHLLVAITDLNLGSHSAGKAKTALNAGSVQWVQGGLSPALMNQGKQEARFIMMEFH